MPSPSSPYETLVDTLVQYATQTPPDHQFRGCCSLRGKNTYLRGENEEVRKAIAKLKKKKKAIP